MSLRAHWLESARSVQAVLPRCWTEPLPSGHLKGCHTCHTKGGVMAGANIVMNFQRDLVREGLKVIKPKIPFLLDGPDLLVWSAARSLIVFFPRPSERASPNLLAGRVASSVLAFPSYIQPVVAIGIRGDETVAMNLGGAVPMLSTSAELVRFAAKNEGRSSNETGQLLKIKMLHMRRFSRIAATSMERGPDRPRASQRVEQFRVSMGLRRWHPGERAVYGLRAAETEDAVILTTTSTRSSRRAAIEATHANYSSLYQLDNAVPYPTTDTVDKGVWAGDLISAGREYALWFALVHASPGARK